MGITPQPAIDRINIRVFPSGNATLNIKIVSVSGTIVMDHNSMHEGLISLDLGNLPAGFYIIELNDGTYVDTEKFLLAR